MAKARSTKFSDLRRRAESSLGCPAQKSLSGRKSHGREALVHELRTHQIELELQVRRCALRRQNWK